MHHSPRSILLGKIHPSCACSKWSPSGTVTSPHLLLSDKLSWIRISWPQGTKVVSSYFKRGEFYMVINPPGQYLVVKWKAANLEKGVLQQIVRKMWVVSKISSFVIPLQVPKHGSFWNLFFLRKYKHTALFYDLFSPTSRSGKLVFRLSKVERTWVSIFVRCIPQRVSCCSNFISPLTDS
jgi:hypothetical protein